MKILDPYDIIGIFASEIKRKNILTVSDTSKYKTLIKAHNALNDYVAYDTIINEISILRKHLKSDSESLLEFTIPYGVVDNILLDEEANPVEPIIDVVVNSLKRNEYKTAEKGLKEIKSSTDRLFDQENQNISKKLKITKTDLRVDKLNRLLDKKRREFEKEINNQSNIGIFISNLNSQLFEIGMLSIEKKAENA
jgi:hypothetical protein